MEEEEEEKEESARTRPNLFECIRGEGRERRNEMTRLYIVPLLLPISLFPSQVVVTVLFLLWRDPNEGSEGVCVCYKWEGAICREKLRFFWKGNVFSLARAAKFGRTM